MYKSSFLSWINYGFSTVPIKVSVFLFLSCLEAKLPNASLSACLFVSLSLQKSLLFINPVSEFAVSRSPNFWRDKNVWGTLSQEMQMKWDEMTRQTMAIEADRQTKAARWREGKRDRTRQSLAGRGRVGGEGGRGKALIIQLDVGDLHRFQSENKSLEYFCSNSK